MIQMGYNAASMIYAKKNRYFQSDHFKRKAELAVIEEGQNEAKYIKV